MTLVIGSHFGNVTGIMADTRGTETLPNGQKIYWDDCVKIKNVLPSLSVGIAGAAQPAARLLDSFLAAVFQGMSSAKAPEIHAHIVDVGWMGDMMRATHGGALKSGMLQPTDRFTYMFSTQDLTSLTQICGAPPALRLLSVLGPRQASFKALTQLLTQEDGTSHLRKVFSISLPSGRILEAAPGEVLLIGSGARVEPALAESKVHLAVFPGSRHVGVGDRVGAVGHSIGHSKLVQEDTTFNGIMLGVGVSAPWYEFTLSSFPQWPKDGVPETSLQWQPLDPEESIGPSYSAGFDSRQENLAWIYAADAGCRLRLRSLFGLLAEAEAEDFEF